MSYALIRESERTANLTHRCIWCGDLIDNGSAYIDQLSTFEGTFQHHKWHPECRTDARAQFIAGEPEFAAYSHERPLPSPPAMTPAQTEKDPAP